MEIESDYNSTINDRYTFLKELGKGASSKVYLVENKIEKKKYAIKVFNKRTPLFKREIEILEKVSSLNCPYLINLKEFGEDWVNIDSNIGEYKQYIIFDYAPKGELFDYIFCSQTGIKEKYAKLIFGKILRGVQALHKRGICHRDLKMQNILLDELFNPKICDFGFAAQMKGKNGKLKQYLGTLNYASPEMYLKRPYNGIKVDIFSLGVILLNLVTCKIGFIQATKDDDYYKNIMIRHFNLYWKIVEPKIGKISDELKSLYIKMVSFNPHERPTIDEILKSPWMKEIEDLNEDEYNLVEKEVFKEFQKLENIFLEKCKNNKKYDKEIIK